VPSGFWFNPDKQVWQQAVLRLQTGTATKNSNLYGHHQELPLCWSRSNQNPIKGSNLMPMNYLGKVLFPQQQPWKQRRQARIVVIVLLVTVIFSGIIVAVMFLGNSKH